MENGSTTDNSLELQVCTLQEKVLRIIDEEDVLRDLKNETAADFRERIKAVTKERKIAQKELKALTQEQYEEEGTEILESNEDELEAAESDPATVEVAAE